MVAGTALVACTYGLVRLAYGLFLPDVQATLSMSAATAGYVASGASVAYCVGAVCGMGAADRSRGLVLGALLTASLGSVGMAVAPGQALFVPAAVLASTGAGLASPGLVALVDRSLPAARRDRAQATVNAGTGPGLVAAGLLALVLLPQWRLGFTISAVLTVVAGIGVLLLDRPGAGTHPGVRTAYAAPSRRRARGWTRVLSTPALAAVLLGAASAVVWTYGRAHLVAEGMSAGTSTLAWVLVGAGGAITVLTSRRLSDLAPARAWSLSVAAVAVSIVVLGAAGGHAATALAACAVFGWGFVAATSALIAWAAHRVPDRAAAGTSLLFVALVLGQAAGSAAAGAVAERLGLETAFVLSAAVAVLAALTSVTTSASLDGLRRGAGRPVDPVVQGPRTQPRPGPSATGPSPRRSPARR